MLILLNRKEVLKEIKNMYRFYNNITVFFNTESKQVIIETDTEKFLLKYDTHNTIIKRMPHKKYDYKVYYSLVSNNEVTLDANLEYIKTFGMDLKFEYIKNDSISGSFYNIIP